MFEINYPSNVLLTQSKKKINQDFFTIGHLKSIVGKKSFEKFYSVKSMLVGVSSTIAAHMLECTVVLLGKLQHM